MARYKFQEFIKKQEKRFLKTEVTNSDLIRISDANHYFEMYKKQLIIPVISGSFSAKDMENFAAKCMILGNNGKDTKELLKDFCDNDL